MIYKNDRSVVLLNCTSSKSGGALNYIRNLVPSLYKDINKKEIRLIILARNDQSDLLKSVSEDDLIIVKDDFKNPIQRFLWESKNLSKIARDNCVTTIFTPSQIVPIVKGIKNIVMLRNMEPFKFIKYRYSFKLFLRNILVNLISKYTLKRADKIISVSRYASSYLYNNLNISNDKVFQIYHGSPYINKQENFFKESSIVDKSEFIFTCGSILPYRRLEDVIKAFFLIADSINKNCKLVIAGKEIDINYAQKIRRLIKKSKYHQRVIFLGSINWEEMFYYYSNSKLVVISTEIEACPNIALEAMASGSRIVAAEIQPLTEILKDSAIYYKARNVNQLSSLVKTIIQENDLDNDYSLSAVKRSNDFSWEKCTNETIKAISN